MKSKTKIYIVRERGDKRSTLLMCWNLQTMFLLIHKPQFWRSFVLNWCTIVTEIALCAPPSLKICKFYVYLILFHTKYARPRTNMSKHFGIRNKTKLFSLCWCFEKKLLSIVLVRLKQLLLKSWTVIFLVSLLIPVKNVAKDLGSDYF